MEEISIRLINAEQYIKRRDIQNPSWFALPINLLDTPDFFGITGNEFKAFFYVISMHAKLRKYEFKINIDHCCHNLQIDQTELKSILNKLDQKMWQVVDFIDDVTPTLQIRTDTLRRRTATVHNTTSQNTFDRSTLLGSIKFDFENLYKKYPKKVGKKKGFQKLSREIKTQADFDNLSLAIDRYVSFCRENKTSQQFIKQFDSFVTVWRDYLEEDFGQSADFSQKIKNNFGMVQDF